MTMSSQRISDQVRVIRSRKFLSEVETENIKIVVSERLGMVQIENEEQPTEPFLERSMAIEAAPPEEEDKDIDKLGESLLSQHVIYEGIPLDDRPILSKIPYSFKSRLTVNRVNEALSRIIVDYPEMTVEAVCHWAYVAASVIIIELGLEKHGKKKDKNHTKLPRWQRRLQNKIASLRANIGVITSYIRNPVGAKQRAVSPKHSCSPNTKLVKT
ncbi:unnamed protein product [Nezara viridula]|uniref:Uncharacterized protein n=1 Tax=Nezara viridula TaxID=85310 RepID=A0A9P0ECZ4_NEZVI|nr:unnamed protein product [Nezara viridula]